MAKSSPPPLEGWLWAYELGDQLEANAVVVTLRGRRKSDGRAVLVRTVKPGLRSTELALAVLAREKRVLETTTHVVLPTLLEVMRSPSQLALIYADAAGHRLSDVLDRQPRIAPASALAIAVALAGVLAAMHREGFVHGRLRVESIEVTGSGHVVLHDPGGAGARGGGGDPDLDAPENMAPEQVLGQAAGPETDIYLLGALVYHMVAGALPFSSGTGGITQQIRHAEPPPLVSLAPDTPRDLQRIVTRCLRKRGRDRYPDMMSLESELLRVLRSHTSLSREHLITRALADAGLATELPIPRERGVGRGAATAPPWVHTAMRWSIGAVLVLGLIALVWAFAGTDKTNPNGSPQGIVKRPALIRVLAQPWAEIYVDGDLVDVTPVGEPIEVSPGRHAVLFKHPNAEPITRDIEITAGQTMVLDVEMAVVRPPDAGAPDAGDAGSDAAPE